jgi:hypothetical protein
MMQRQTRELPRGGSPARVTAMPAIEDAEAGADHVEARLMLILGMVNQWLQFAEMKNTAIVGLTSTGVSALLIYLVAVQDPSPLLLSGLLLAGGLMIVSLAVALVSFLPQTSLSRLLTRIDDSPHESDNFYFYGHLAKYTRHAARLADSIARLYFHLDDYDPSEQRSHLDLAAQVAINARITTSKYRLFTRAAVLFVAGVAVAIVTLLIEGVR